MPVKKDEIDRYAKDKGGLILVEYLIEKVEKEFKTKEKAFGEKFWMDVVRAIFLSTID